MYEGEKLRGLMYRFIGESEGAETYSEISIYDNGKQMRNFR